MRLLRLALLLGAALASVPAFADETAAVEQWYTALAKADGAALGDLLAPNAVVVLKDIGTSQTKAEFIASMDEWKTAIEGGSIRHKPDGAVEGGLAYKVCYDFAENDLLTREVFVFESGLVKQSEQISLAENCDGY